MIELLRYARLKPDGLVSAEAHLNSVPRIVVVKFKRFSVENGKELSPEESVVMFDELEERLEELKKELEVVQELLALKSE